MILTQEYKEHWSSIEKIVFKFIFVYFSLYIFLMFFSSFLEVPIKWFGSLLSIDYSYEANGYGSGDNTFAYITLFANVVLTLIISSLWIFLDYKRKSYNKLLYWSIVSLRIFLVFFMFVYGFVKIIQLQFPYPSLTRMLEPLGNFSPMGLAWTYLGYSKVFNFFMGFMEVLGGLLLIPRRTSTLGSFIIFGVMSHVAVMNFVYDIPVKIFSTHLALIALFIFSTDCKRFINVFIKNKPVNTFNFFHPIKDKTYHKFIFWIKSISLMLLIDFSLVKGLGNDRGKDINKNPYLHGVWEVSEFIKDGDTLAPLITDGERWRYLIIDRDNMATVKTMDEVNYSYKVETDSVNRKMKIYDAGIKSDKYNFEYELLNDSTLTIKGSLYLIDHNIKLKKKDILLYSRGFNWINEKPLNR